MLTGLLSLKVDTKDKETINMKDFNIDLMSSKTHPKWYTLTTLFQIFSEFTRVTQTLFTFIDHVYFNLSENIDFIQPSKTFNQ